MCKGRYSPYSEIRCFVSIDDFYGTGSCGTVDGEEITFSSDVGEDGTGSCDWFRECESDIYSCTYTISTIGFTGGDVGDGRS